MQQDNDTEPSVSLTKDFIRGKVIVVHWPSQSPDQPNPTEQVYFTC